jgi:hypothetical protein
MLGSRRAATTGTPWVTAGPVLTMDRRPSAVLTRVFAGSTARTWRSYGATLGSTSGGSALVLAATFHMTFSL